MRMITSSGSDFNPRSPRGGATLEGGSPRKHKYGISIHAPHEGERRDGCGLAPDGRDFNPRSPRGGATALNIPCAQPFEISIHAPHEGERPAYPKTLLQPIRFQSTLPTRGSDAYQAYRINRQKVFQSTLPTRGSDLRYTINSIMPK